MAERGRKDLHFFCWFACGFTALTPPGGLHGRMCQFLESGGHPRKWVEVFRGGAKSTVATVGYTLQKVVKDLDSHILVVSAVEDLSRSFLRQIMEIVEGGETFRWLYPEVEKGKKTWSDREASIARSGSGQGSVREATWKAGSVGKGVTGGHFTDVHYDDLVIPENCETADLAAKVIDRFVSWRPLLDQWGTPEVMCSTPYKDYDLSAWLKRSQPGMFRRLSVPVEDAEGRLAWVEEFPRERLEELKALDYEMFSAQYLLEPLPPELQTFKQDTFRYWKHKDEEGVDAALPVDVKRLTCYMGVDPGTGLQTGDPSAIVVVGVDDQKRYFVVESLHGCWDTTYLFEMMFQMWNKYRIERTWLEMAGPFASLAAGLKAEMDRRGEYHFVEKAHVGTERKEQRIRLTLGPYYHASRMYHYWPERGGDMEQQLLRFPKAAHDDIVDAEAYAMRLAQDFGHYGRAGEDAIAHQVNSGFGQWEKVAYTLEELQSRPPAGMLKHAGALVGKQPEERRVSLGLW